MTWVEAAAARLGIPTEEDLLPVHYPRPTRWARCSSCRSTVWSLGLSPNAAADAMAVHAAFCRGNR